MRRVTVSLVAAITLLVVAVTAGPGSTRGSRMNPAIRAALAQQAGHLPQRLPNGNPIPPLSGGLVHSVEEGLRLTRTASGAAPADATPAPPTIGTAGCSNVFTAPGFPDNVRANQDCGYRFQSEEWVAVNPTDPTDVVVSQNDSSLSGNHTGVDYSIDGGQHFGDSQLPAGRENFSDAPSGAWSFDFFSDPAHAFDSHGNLYYTAIGADFLQDGFSGIFVWKSNSCLKGATLHAPGGGSCSPFRPPLDASATAVHTNFADPANEDDKEMIAADSFPQSPHRDNVYITWTRFRFHCGIDHSEFCDSPILFSRSHDHGVTWSPAKAISGVSRLCGFGDAFDPHQPRHACNVDQGSFPVVGPDGTIYVVFLNYNTTRKAVEAPGGLINQFLVVKSTDAGHHWSRPVRVAKDFGTEPYSLPGAEIQDCDLIRQCLPPNGYRLWDEPSMGIDPATGKLAVFWQDFRNGGPCHTAFELPAPPCDNYNSDVFASVSTDGGSTWGPPRLVTGNAGTTAQWQSWGDVGSNGTLSVAYYDREYGDCESTGCNDITLATSLDDGADWTYRRITTTSMPNLGCDVNSQECGFLGDYMSLQARNGNVYLAWGDTRGLGGTTEEDVYYATVRG